MVKIAVGIMGSSSISDGELLQRYRRDRRELLEFLLSSSVFKKVVMPPGAVAFEDIDIDHISVDYILDCARKGGALELAEAIKKYHADLSLPPAAGAGLDEVFFLVTHPSYSGPAPTRAPPAVAVSAAAAFLGPHSPPSVSKKFSLRSVPLSVAPRQLSADDIDELDDAEEEDEFSTETTRRQLANTSEVVVGLPPFATGLSDDDLRETAYEVLLVAVGAAGGLIVPPKEKQEKKSKLARRFARTKVEKAKPAPPPATGLAGLMDTMRTQMEISEADDWRTRQGLLSASQGRVGKRMDTLLVPLELLCTVSKSNFADQRAHSRWQKRQLSVLEEGLLSHPAVRLDATDPRAVELRSLIAKLEEADALPPPAGPAQEAQALRGLRMVALPLSERPGTVDQPGEICHWADGYHLNVRIYEKLLGSVFDVLEEGHLVEEVEEILELLKSTWRVLGITPIVHNTVYAWVLFRQFVLTGEEALLKHAALQVKRIGSDAQCSAQERDYLKSLRCTFESINGPEELSYLQSFLGPIEQWAEKRLGDYHSNFADSARTMEPILTLALISGSLIADKAQGRTNKPYSTDTEAVAKNYIQTSMNLAYERIVEQLDSVSETQEEEEQAEHPLTTLAEGVENLAKKEAHTFAPILSAWHPHAIAIAASNLHRLFGQELRPFLDGVSQFSDDVASVLPAADNLEVYLLDVVSRAAEDGKTNSYMQHLELYHVEVQSEKLLKRWVNSQLSRVSEWVDRTVQQEKWEPVSTSKRYAGSIVEVFRIVDETTDQFFNLRLPMRLPVLKTLTMGFNSAFLIYINKLFGELGDKADLVSPPPTLTRYKRDMAVKSTSKKKVVDPRLPDDARTQQINSFTTVALCVRLNTLHHIETQVDALESNMRERWTKKRPRDDLSHSSSEDSRHRRGSSSAKSGDELSVVFEPTRKACSVTIDKICDFTGTKIIFWDSRDAIIEGLYKISVSQARMEKVTNVLDPVLGQLCEMIEDPLRDRVVLGLLQAALEGLLRVLLDGGPARAFAQSDSDMLEEDLSLLKEFFIADGDGLPRSVVNSAASPVQQILNLYTLETSIVIDSFKRASDQMVAGTSSVQRMGPRVATDADTLLRVLCHRLDREASKFLKKHYNLPKV